jgi:hypothetical protein
VELGAWGLGLGVAAGAWRWRRGWLGGVLGGGCLGLGRGAGAGGGGAGAAGEGGAQRRDQEVIEVALEAGVDARGVVAAQQRHPHRRHATSAAALAGGGGGVPPGLCPPCPPCPPCKQLEVGQPVGEHGCACSRSGPRLGPGCERGIGIGSGIGAHPNLPIILTLPKPGAPGELSVEPLNARTASSPPASPW